MNSVYQLCNNGIVLTNGSIELVGSAEKCINYYIKDRSTLYKPHCILSENDHLQNCTRQLEILEAELLNDEVSELSSDEIISIKLTIRKNTDNCKSCQYCVFIYDDTNTRIETLYTEPMDIPSSSTYSVLISITNHGLIKGNYQLMFSLGNRHYATSIINHDITKQILSFNIKYISKKPKISYLPETNWYRGIHHSLGYIHAQIQP